jgi:hypothetical protein
VSARCALIEAEKATYKIVWMCALLGVARSSFYAWRARVETPSAARRRQLAEKIKQVFDESRQTFGCRRIARELNDAGHVCSVGLIASLMRELGLKAVQPARPTAAPRQRRRHRRRVLPHARSPSERRHRRETSLINPEGWGLLVGHQRGPQLGR